MRIVGIIAEYNPFHNGHAYHIQKAKELAHADAVVVVMSGNYVQRGTPAIMPKHIRAEIALKAGASLVIELPVRYATGTAEQFAYGAVALLEKLGCVDAICFGSECGDIHALEDVAKILADEPTEYKELLQDLLRTGLSFPTARQQALEALFPEKNFKQILSSPNNILGIEYIKALYRLNSKIIPITIPRNSSEYHDTNLSGMYSSASAVRKLIEEHRFSELEAQLPEGNVDIFFQIFEQRFPVYANDFSLLLKYRLLNEAKSSLAEYEDVSEELANRIYNQQNQFENFEQFCQLLKTKELTYTRISRALLHIILCMKKQASSDISCARVLGFALDDATVMSTIKKYSEIPLITKLTATDALSEDIYTSNLYEVVLADKFGLKPINEYEHPVVRI